MGCHLGRQEPPALQVRLHLRLARPGVVEHQRRVEVRPPARVERSLDGQRVVEIDLDAGLATHNGGEGRAAVALEQEVWRDGGDSLRHDRLRRGHHHHGLLEQPPPTDEPQLFAASLGVVAGIRLVHRQDEQLDP